MDLTANYQKIFGEHSFNVLFGYSYQKFNTEGMSAGNQDFINDSFLYNNLGAGNYSRPPVGSYASVSSLSSYFGRFNYSWKEKIPAHCHHSCRRRLQLCQRTSMGLFPFRIRRLALLRRKIYQELFL